MVVGGIGVAVGVRQGTGSYAPLASSPMAFSPSARRTGLRATNTIFIWQAVEMITERQPEDWHELQNDVARILTECGMQAEVEKRSYSPEIKLT